MHLKFCIAAFFCILSFTGCLSVIKEITNNFDNPPIVLEKPFFLSVPEDGSLVFIGASGKMSNPKDTVKYAIENAANQVAMYYEIYGEYVVKNNIGSGAFDYSYETRTTMNYDTEGSSKYIDSLEYDVDKDTFEIDNSLFIRTVYPASLPLGIDYRPKYTGTDKKPDWVDSNSFEINGYEVGIGCSTRYSSTADTFKNSRNNAVFSIIKSINSSTSSNNMLYKSTDSLFGYKTSNDNEVSSFGTLNNFYVLDTWMDPKSKSVWTLAIAKK